MSAAAAKRTALAAASLFALVALALVGTTSAAPPDKDRSDPSTPTNLHVAAATKTTVTLAWDPSSDDVAVAGYYVFGDRGKATVDTNLEQPTYTVSGLSCGQSVALSVIAFDAAGNRSQQANATVSSAPCSDSVPPSSPAGFTQLSTSENAVVLAWTASTDNVGVVSYGVYRNLALLQSASDPQVALGGLSCGSSYEYAFDAVDAAGNRSQLVTASVRTSDCPVPTPAPSEWSFCANEWERCSFSGSKDVRYGANGTFTSPRTFSDGVECTNAVFGDPLAGTPKQCQTRAASGSTPPPAPAPAPATDTQPPSAPSGLASSNVTQTGLTLTWSASSDNVGVVSYDVSRDGTQVASATSPSASVSGLTCASSYAFAVRARDAAGNVSQPAQLSVSTAACAAPAPAPAPDTQAPTAPASLAISAASATSVSLTWNASSDNVGVVGYRSYRDSSYVSTGTQTAATISGLACGSAHTFAVNAFDQAGNSSASSSVIGSTLACVDTQAPSAPANVSVSSRTATSIALTWSPSTDNVGVTAYGLYQGGTSTLQSAGTVGIFTGLACNTNYTLAIDAVDAAGNRSAKTTLMVSTTACPDTQAPSAPTGLAASNVTQTGLTLSWSASTDNVGVVSYDLYRNGTKVASPTAPSASQTALTCGTSYSFGVEALDAAGNRSARATLSASTAACATTTSTWTFCANENQRCSFTGSQSVRYGANGTFTTPRTFTDGVDCTNAVFGDPLVGTPKQCQLWSSTGAPPASPPAPSLAAPGPISGLGYNLVFSDEFSNFSYTNSPINDAYTWQRPYNGGNDPGAVSVDANKVLHLKYTTATATKPVLIGTRKSPGNYQGSWTYGYFEASIAIPAGIGAYPQFWLSSTPQIWGLTCSSTTQWGNGSPLLNPEIDMLEGGWEQGGWGKSGIQQYNTTVHSDTDGACGGSDQIQTHFNSSGPLDGTFHTYAVRWTPSTITFYLDGVQTASFATPASANVPMYLLLGSDRHSSYQGTVPSVIDTQVAWVHVWQK